MLRLRTLAICALTALVAIAGLAASVAPASAAEDGGADYRQIHFPVDGAASYTDDFGAPRTGHTHEGNDLMGKKLEHLVAATDGTVAFARVDASGTSGNMLTIKDADGWRYSYLHVNNDTPGTDDGLNPPEWIFAPGIEVGSKVKAGELVGYLGDSGNAETTGPHLHFEIRQPDNTPIDPWTSLRLAQGLTAGPRCAYNTNPKGKAAAAAGAGYYVLGGDGGIFSFGSAPFYGSVPGLALKAKVTALRLATTQSGKGYTILGADGGIFTFGDATFFGSVPGVAGPGVKALDLRMTPTGKGYWVMAADGGVFAFGDAGFYGSVPGLGLKAKAIRLVPTPTGQGYWVLAADGGVFSFGDAVFNGSVPGVGVNTTVVAMAASAKSGYWVLGDDGGVFSFGVPFYGSVPGVGLCKPSHGVQLKSSATGKGYWVVGTDGAVWAFGDAPWFGGVPGLSLGTAVSAVDIDPAPPLNRG